MMPSPALDAFHAKIDNLSLTKKAKDDLKQFAEEFYHATTMETVDHVEFHLDAVISDNPTDTELKTRAELIRTWLEQVRLDGNLALGIHGGLEA